MTDIKAHDGGRGQDQTEQCSEKLQPDAPDTLQRRLNSRQIQLIAVGGSIGTALFVSIGKGLAAGGPASLFIAYALYSLILACVNNCIAEMITLYPVSGGFIRLAGKWVDDALGFMVGWNFFFYEALLIPFEITAINVILSYWSDNIPVAAVCVAVIVVYALINSLAVQVYGEAEFWLSGGKVILIIMLFFFTFITMLGGNPQRDVYGFRYWSTPGPFKEHPLRDSQGNLGRFEGFLACLWSAAFTIVGPEYITMVAAEAKHPRAHIKTAYKVMFWRFGLFFVLGALCVGILVPSNDPTLEGILTGHVESGSSTASPYIIAMTNLGIGVLPDIVNALMLTSIFSAGNTYTYCATRTLYSLALEGRAPKLLSKCTSKGVPMYSLAVVLIFPLLSFLQLSNNSSIVLNWLIDLITASALIDFLVMCITYLAFYRACRVQGVLRNEFPYSGYLQPYCAWIGGAFTLAICLSYGYTAFHPWSVESFFRNYTMQIITPALYLGWKVMKGTKIKKPEEVDLVWELPIINSYESNLSDAPVGFWREIQDVIAHSLRKGNISSET